MKELNKNILQTYALSNPHTYLFPLLLFFSHTDSISEIDVINHIKNEDGKKKAEIFLECQIISFLTFH